MSGLCRSLTGSLRGGASGPCSWTLGLAEVLALLAGSQFRWPASFSSLALLTQMHRPLQRFFCIRSDLGILSSLSGDGFQTPLPLPCLTLLLCLPHTRFIFLLPPDTCNMVSATDSSCSESCLQLKFKNRWTRSILDAVPISTT